MTMDGRRNILVSAVLIGVVSYLPDLEQVRSGLAPAYLNKDARNGQGRRLACKQDEKDIERFIVRARS